MKKIAPPEIAELIGSANNGDNRGKCAALPAVAYRSIRKTTNITPRQIKRAHFLPSIARDKYFCASSKTALFTGGNSPIFPHIFPDLNSNLENGGENINFFFQRVQ